MTIDLAILLASIAVVESNSDDEAIGLAGERGRYQITREVWDKWMPRKSLYLYKSLFEVGAHDHGMARWVAERHIRFSIIPELEKAGREVTVFAIASCWNAGIVGHLEHDRGSAYGWKVVDEYARRAK